MIRSKPFSRWRAFLLFVACAVCASPMAALAAPDPAKPGDKKPAPAKGKDAKPKPDAKAKPDASKPVLVATVGEWGAYTAGAGKSRTCYALAKPKDRQPGTLKRDPGYVFISNRPGESVKNEISFVMGFEVKPDGKASAEIGSTTFDLVAKGSNLWVKNPAEEPAFVDAIRKGQRLIIKSLSKKGNASTDTYILAGAAQALDRAAKDCQ